jgi:hypothetical protein
VAAALVQNPFKKSSPAHASFVQLAKDWGDFDANFTNLHEWKTCKADRKQPQNAQNLGH